MIAVGPAVAKRVMFVFTRDLRLGDHLGLSVAGRIGSVVPVLIIDPASAERLRRSPRRASFFCAAVEALDRDLRARGSGLIVRRGRSGALLPALARSAGASAVAWSVGYDAKTLVADRDRQSVLEEAGLQALPVHDAPVVAPEDGLALNRHGDAYRAFAPYFARWRAAGAPERLASATFIASGLQSEPLPRPAEFGSDSVCAREVSEAAAAAACAGYLELPVLSYSAGRNGPAAAAGTSKFSADLAFGTLAARTVVRAVHERLRDPFLLTEEKTSLRLFLRAFAQRDFFLQLAWHTEALAEAPLQTKMRGFRFARSHRHLTAWRDGRTGFPIVDAGIRELHATGWMHPRVRAIAASFLCFDLGVDWRVGRDEWDRWLVEDTPALATANWQWSAGVGADLAAYPRIFNPLKAAVRFDPAAVYIRRWIPELALAPDDTILDPQARRGSRQLALDLFGQLNYPSPVVDHAAAARGFLERYTREVRAASA